MGDDVGVYVTSVLPGGQMSSRGDIFPILIKCHTMVIPSQTTHVYHLYLPNGDLEQAYTHHIHPSGHYWQRSPRIPTLAADARKGGGGGGGQYYDTTDHTDESR